MIIDNVERVIRRVELDANSEPVASLVYAGVARRADGSLRSEEDLFAEMQANAALSGHTLVRLCNHEDDCRNPNLDEIEGDGRGGIRAQAGAPDALTGVQFWDASTMERAFIAAIDERMEPVDGEPVRRVVRLEPGQWDAETLKYQLRIRRLDDGRTVVVQGERLQAARAVL